VNRTFPALLIAALSLAAIGCDQAPAAADSSQNPAPAVVPGGEPPQSGRIVGTVISSMDASNYTYVEVDTGSERVWAAGPQTPVTVGETVSLSNAMPMPNFHSKSLDRTFDQLYFVSAIGRSSIPNGAQPSAMAPHPIETAAQPEMDFSGIVRAEDGHTIADIFEGRSTLAGHEVAVRGIVVKVNTQILGKNWIHLQDGTVGPGGETKLIATGSETAEVGSTVLVRGILATDQDLGHGYQYDALIEEAKISVE
jgi:hypothetical protein